MSAFNTLLVWLYNGLQLCMPILLVLGVSQLVLAGVAWKSPKRNRRLVLGAGLLLGAAMIPLLLMGLWRGLIRPSLAAANLYRMAFVADPDRQVYPQFARELVPRTYSIGVDRRIKLEIVEFDQY